MTTRWLVTDVDGTAVASVPSGCDPQAYLAMAEADAVAWNAACEAHTAWYHARREELGCDEPQSERFQNEPVWREVRTGPFFLRKTVRSPVHGASERNAARLAAWVERGRASWEVLRAEARPRLDAMAAAHPRCAHTLANSSALVPTPVYGPLSLESVPEHPWEDPRVRALLDAFEHAYQAGVVDTHGRAARAFHAARGEMAPLALVARELLDMCSGGDPSVDFRQGRDELAAACTAYLSGRPPWEGTGVTGAMGHVCGVGHCDPVGERASGQPDPGEGDVRQERAHRTSWVRCHARHASAHTTAASISPSFVYAQRTLLTTTAG